MMRSSFYTSASSLGAQIFAALFAVGALVAFAFLAMFAFVFVLFLAGAALVAAGIWRVYRTVFKKSARKAGPEPMASRDGVVLEARRGPHGWSVDPAR